MKYIDIVNFIKVQIASEEIKIGNKLPSIRDLVDRFGCSKSTVVRAYDELESEHIIYAVPNSGYYLVEKKVSQELNYTGEVIDFSSAAPDSSVLPYDEFQHCITQALDVYKDKLFSYIGAKGLKPLVLATGKLLQNYQVFAKEESIYITTGSQQALDILTRMPFPNGKRNIAIEQPTYSGMLKSIELNGITPIGVKRDLSGLNMEDLERVFKNGNVKFFYTVPRFNNPFGLSYSNSEKKQIARWAEKYDVYILEDDYLGDMEVNSKADPIYSFDESSRVIYLKSFSKALLPGLRVAAVVLPQLLVNVFRDYKKCADLNTTVLSQGALEIYINSGMFTTHVKKMRSLYSNRLACLGEVLGSIGSPNIRCKVPEGGFFAGIQILNGVKVKSLLKNEGCKNLLLSNPRDFYLREFIREDSFRISIARANEERIRKGVRMLVRGIDEG